MSWAVLLVAGVLEAVWAVGLKHTEGFTRLWPSVLVGLAIVASMGLLGVAAKNLPISTAYPCGSASAPSAPSPTASLC